MVIIDTVVLLLTGCLRPETVNLSKEKLLPHLTIVAAAAAVIAGIAYWRYEDLLTNKRARFLMVDQLLEALGPEDRLERGRALRAGQLHRGLFEA